MFTWARFEYDVLWSYRLKSLYESFWRHFLAVLFYYFLTFFPLLITLSVRLIHLFSDSWSTLVIEDIHAWRLYKVNIRATCDFLRDVLSRRSSYCHAEKARHSSNISGTPSDTFLLSDSSQSHCSCPSCAGILVHSYRRRDSTVESQGKLGVWIAFSCLPFLRWIFNQKIIN